MNKSRSFRPVFGLAASLTCVLSFAGPVSAGEIGWIEDYALASDRTTPLKQLIPGTEDYYYYHCLYYQSAEQWDKVDELLKAWIARYQYTPRAIEVENRQALLNYTKNPGRSLDLIRNRLNLQFNHQQERLNEKPNLATKLDPALISAARLNRQALDQFPNTVQGFEEAALDWLVETELNPEQLRHLLSRLLRPDHPGLVKLIVADLNHVNSGGFGQFEIHRRLLLDQLDELLKLKPELRNQDNFINTYIARLRPSDDVNWRQDPKALRAYLERQWAFVKTLDQAHNSLKAHVLYHWLELDRREGKYDLDRFIEYLKLPKNVVYIQPKSMEPVERRQFAANLNQDFAPFTMLPIVGDDTALVRSYLEHFLLDADDYKAFLPYINEDYLKQVFAEIKIVNGLGDAEKLYSMLPPAVYQQLKERIDLDFAFTNKTELAPEDPVALDLYVKNVDALIVKVFEINTQNYYREHLGPIGPDINLDGLVANEEHTYNYKELPLRRVKRHFTFPALNHRGVFVIDFIGNGKASRALIRKGKLQYIVRNSVAGQIFTILDEQNKPAPEATLWMAGTLFTPDKDGTIAVPFSNQPGQQPIVLTLGDFSSLDRVQQEGESYHLQAAMYVDREELIARRKAQLIIRPQLSVAGVPVSRKSLEEVRLSIVSTDLDNVVSIKEAADFKLFDDRDTVYEFQVPQRLANIRFEIKARIQSASRNQKLDLTASQSFSLNEIDRTDKTEDLHFARAADDFTIDLLGKTGESKMDRPIQLVFKLRDYTQPVYVSLKTDESGRVQLGPLPGVVTVTATSPQGVSHAWNIRHDEHTYPKSIHAETGDVIQTPYMGGKQKPSRAELSLIELRGDQFTADRFENLSIKDGLIQIEKLPPGDYSLLLKKLNHQIRIRVTEGTHLDGYALGDYRKLEVRNARPLQIASIDLTETKVRVQLENVTPQTRLHILATRFEPAYPAFNILGAIAPPEPYSTTVPRTQSQYVAGRNIGDEYRYIIDRKFAKKYPGNMLERPSLLLNPWAIRSTETGQQIAQAGEDFSGPANDTGRSAGGQDGKGVGGVANPTDFADLDFLAASSIVLANVVPDKNGLVEFKKADLEAHQQLLILAIDPQNTASRIVALPEAKSDYIDLRLSKPLDPKQHFTRQKRIGVLKAKETLTIADIGSARFESFDTLGKAIALYTAINGDAQFVEFGFIRDWPTLKAEQKRALYKKYASHELHLLLYKKDPEFFKSAIRPYLANKKDKQFIDHWLLDDDLSQYLKPWNFEQLNALERVLLGQRLEGQRALIARLTKEQFELLPPDPERFNHLFETALKGSSLDTGDKLGLRQAQQHILSDEMKKLSPDLMKKDVMMGGIAAPAEEPTALTVNGPAPGAPPPPAAAAKSANLLRERAAMGGKRSAMETKKSRSLSKDSKGDEALDMEIEADFFADDRAKQAAVRQYYRKLDKTMEWAESNYFHLVIEQQTPGVITTNSFWKDLAAHDPADPFYSTNMAEATHTMHEMLAALALLDLPFTAGDHKTNFKGAQMTLTAASPMIVYHEEIQPATKVAEHSSILVSENFFRNGDRFRIENGEQIDKFVSEEFLIDTVYGCQIVVTNPTSSKKKVDVLLQIPAGALPVSNGQFTRSVHIDLEPYHTQTLEYYFYFPLPGKFAHYPVQVATGGEVLAFAAPFTFNAVRLLTNIDKQSWDYISQYGTPDDVLGFLKTENVLRVNLDRIAWRMQDKEFFGKVIALLSARHIYNNTLWSYSVKHNDAPAIRQFLQFANDFVRQCGDWLDSPLLAIDPIERRDYQHLEYWPLVNARVGQLGRKREILNDRFFSQYQRLLKILSYRGKLDGAELISVTYYLLLQDRVSEAFDQYDAIKPAALATKLQYDYLTAYMDFYKADSKAARTIAVKYAEYPIERWQKLFANVVNQADEIDRREHDVKLADKENRTQVQTSEAATAPSFDFTVDAKKVKVNYQNLKQVRVNYYQMDIELLFSRNPFVQGDSKQFANILPNQTALVVLPAKGSTLEFPLPPKLVNGNLLIEIVGDGQTKSQAYYSNALGVQLVENYGQVRVTQAKDSAPLPKAYVKVYSRMKDGAVKFYKDGYTDLRGYFDYTSLSTNEGDFVDKFSILILSDEFGAVVREAKPPKQ